MRVAERPAARAQERLLRSGRSRRVKDARGCDGGEQSAHAVQVGTRDRSGGAPHVRVHKQRKQRTKSALAPQRPKRSSAPSMGGVAHALDPGARVQAQSSTWPRAAHQAPRGHTSLPRTGAPSRRRSGKRSTVGVASTDAASTAPSRASRIACETLDGRRFGLSLRAKWCVRSCEVQPRSRQPRSYPRRRQCTRRGCTRDQARTTRRVTHDTTRAGST
jgi:hypothetical protein